MCWIFIIYFFVLLYSVCGSLVGYRVEGHSGGSGSLRFDEDYTPQFELGINARLRLFGQINSGDLFAFTQDKTSCQFLRGNPTKITVDGPNTGVVDLKIPLDLSSMSTLYICIKDSSAQWNHQDSSRWLRLVVFRPLFPVWADIVVIVFCVSVSSLFNGLCLGLLALDVTDLRVIASSGTEREKMNAQKILPVRLKGNELLCSILLTSTLANAIFTVLVDTFVEGWIAIIASTLIIVIFVEIIPCAVVSRYGILIGAKTIWLTKGVMILTFPLSFTLGKLLDRILGQEISMYTKDRIKELVKITSVYTKMEKQEVDIISGALELSSKFVKEIMTPIDDVYMLSLDRHLDLDTIASIVKSGYSRIPIYEGDRSNIVSLLFTKDLAIVDPEDSTEIKTLVNFYKNECIFVHEDTTLNRMFGIFKEAQKGHLAIVYSSEYIMNNKKYYETVGLVTLEDVLEEVIQSEIVDETDTILDNKSKKKSSIARRRRDVSQYLEIFSQEIDNRHAYISPHLRMATLQFLSTSVESFYPNNISLNILMKLLRNGTIYYATPRGLNTLTIIFPQPSKGPCFVLILDGQVRVTLSKELITFEGGSFMYFGTPALKEEVDLSHNYDYTVEAIGEVKYLLILRKMYIDACRASVYEATNFQPNLELEEYPELFGEAD